MALSLQTAANSHQASVFCCWPCQQEKRKRRLHCPWPSISSGGQTGERLLYLSVQRCAGRRFDMQGWCSNKSVVCIRSRAGIHCSAVSTPNRNLPFCSAWCWRMTTSPLNLHLIGSKPRRPRPDKVSSPSSLSFVFTFLGFIFSLFNCNTCVWWWWAGTVYILINYFSFWSPVGLCAESSLLCHIPALKKLKRIRAKDKAWDFIFLYHPSIKLLLTV